jgi:AraC-like DNA-binding protein
MKYLWRLRCQQAALLLKGTSIPIGNISDQFGFSTQYHFSRLFKQYYGVAPSIYRKN